MKLFDNDESSTHYTCCSLDDGEDARSVCRKIGIPHYVYNYKDSFKEKVIMRFVEAYENGATPNPCIDCHRFIKFKRLFTRADELGFDYVVTGHYACVDFDNERNRFLLKKAADPSKDQSYVLYFLTQEQLSKTLFPLGKLKKCAVRKIASDIDLINANKHDSQDICFVPDNKYADFIRNFTGKDYPEGDFVDENGNILGRHKGIIAYTVGQRKGLGLSFPNPMYVKEKNVDNNKIVLCENSGLFSKELIATDVNFISVDTITEPVHIKAKIRYNQQEQSATVTKIDDNTIHVVFDEPQRAITIGQAVVLYDGDIVMGGGIISKLLS